MRGATLVREAVRDYLQTAVPEARAVALQQWQMDAATLPSVRKFVAYEIDGIANDQAPIISINVGRASNFRIRDFDAAMAEEYEIRYAVRVYMWVETPDGPDGGVPPNAKEITLSTRDDMAGVVRAALLTRVSLGQPDAMQLIVNTLTEDYSDAVSTGTPEGRFIAAAFFSFDLDFTENLYRRPMGMVPEEGVDTEVYPLP